MSSGITDGRISELIKEVRMLGKLFVRDDGTAQINGYISAGEDGIATASTEKTNMRILSRINDHIVKVLLK